MSEREPDHWCVTRFCEADFEKHGDNFLGVGWTKKQAYADIRHQIMLDCIRSRRGETVSVLDFGCGTSQLYEYILKRGISGIEYSGLDLSDVFVNAAKKKFPGIKYIKADILDLDTELPQFDYILISGVFTFKGPISYEKMWDNLCKIIKRISEFSRCGFAFNVTSKYVDWEHGDLFHVPFDDIAAFLDENISRHFSIRHDYGIFEYTVYVYKKSLAQLADEAEA